MYEQRDIVLIPFPYSDLTENKQRPALIISNSKINQTEDRICCLVTSKIHENDIKIGKNDFESGSLPFKSAVRSHRIFTIHEGIIKRKLCSIKKDFYGKVFNEIITNFKLD
ncbi:MAG: type II toxin-antitoxin system PemK/MazF family toxin [Nanoarchaeota archaeon]